jgi:hypothetical protein
MALARAIAPIAAAVLILASPLAAQTPPPEPAPEGVSQLRHVIGLWDVTTEFIGEDGSSRAMEGQYRFGWVVPDRVVSGMSTMPELNQASGILFFLRPSTHEIEMVSVGADGHLWRMAGPDNGETRITPDTPMSGGSSLMLRFTRYDIGRDSFRSRMEMSTDGGENWRIGNRQFFRRAEGG